MYQAIDYVILFKLNSARKTKAPDIYYYRAQTRSQSFNFHYPVSINKIKSTKLAANASEEINQSGM